MTSPSHLEVERTWELAPGVALPDLGRVPGVAAVRALDDEQLDAVYLDTADLRLAQARTTLRRRTGGRDDGWHLKLPAGTDARIEVRRPLGSSRATTPPRELSSLVRSRTRGARLVRIVRLRTSRRVLQLLDDAGSVLAEVADDTVSGEVLLDPPHTVVWREVEVELVEGGRDVLDAVAPLLHEAGAVPAAKPSKLARTLGGRVPARHEPHEPGATAGSALVAHLDAQVRELLARDPAVRQDEPDSVHRMRVATRRLRSALSSFGPLLDRSATDPVRGELKHLAGVLGAARDAEVLHDRLRAAVDALPAELVLGRVGQRIDDELGRRYREAHARVVEELDGRRYLALLDALDRLVASPPLSAAAARPAAPELRRLVRRSWRRLARAVERAQQAPPGPEHEERLHEARKAAKRARYAAEAAAPVLGRRARRLAAYAEDVQEALGAHQDSVVARGELRRLGATASGPAQNGFTFGLLHAREQAAGEDAVARLDELWRKAARSKAARRLG